MMIRNNCLILREVLLLFQQGIDHAGYRIQGRGVASGQFAGDILIDDSLPARKRGIQEEEVGAFLQSVAQAQKHRQRQLALRGLNMAQVVVGTIHHSGKIGLRHPFFQTKLPDSLPDFPIINLFRHTLPPPILDTLIVKDGWIQEN